MSYRRMSRPSNSFLVVFFPAQAHCGRSTTEPYHEEDARNHLRVGRRQLLGNAKRLRAVRADEAEADGDEIHTR